MRTKALRDNEVLNLTNEFQEKMIGLLEKGIISQGQYELFVVSPIYHGFGKYRHYNNLEPITPYVAAIQDDEVIVEQGKRAFEIYRYEEIEDNNGYAEMPDPKSIKEIEKEFEGWIPRDRKWLNARLEDMNRQTISEAKCLRQIKEIVKKNKKIRLFNEE